jgi:hypothetical protein
VALARHAATVMLRIAHLSVAAVGLADALAAIGSGWGRSSGSTSSEGSIFYDEEFDGPLPQRVRTIVLTSDDDRPAVAARLQGFDDVQVVNAKDVPDVAATGGDGGPGSTAMPGSTRPEQQLALLAVRLEMAAVYQRLVRG